MSREGEIRAHVRIIGGIVDGIFGPPTTLTNAVKTLVELTFTENIDYDEIKVHSQYIIEFIESWYMATSDTGKNQRRD